MRFLISVVFILSSFIGFSQVPEKELISGIILNPDSLPIPDVAIIDLRTGKTARTNGKGFFQIETAEEDSLLAYHIAYKKLFISQKYNGRSLVMDPEIQELLQINVTDNQSDEKKLEQILYDVRRLAPMKKLSGYDRKSVQEYFYDENGSHNKSLSPYFGPTAHISIQKLAENISKINERRQLRKKTLHQLPIKKKKSDYNKEGSGK